MSTFTAKIIAELDTSKIPSAIEKIKNQRVDLQNVKVNRVELATSATATLATQVQNALNAKKFTVNINGVKVSGDVVGTAGSDIGKKISDNINKKIELKIDTGKYAAQISSLQDKLNKLDVSPNKDQFPKIVEELRQINSLYDSLKKKQSTDLIGDSKKLEQSISKVKNELTIAANTTSSLVKNTSSFVSKLQIDAFDNKLTVWLNNNSKAVGEFGPKIETLRNDFKSLGDAVTTTELKTFEERLKAIDSAAAAAGQKGKSLSEQFKIKIDTKEYEAQISSLQTKLAKLDVNPSNGKYSEIKSELEQIGLLYEKLKNNTTGDLTQDATKLEQSLSKVKNELSAAASEAGTFVSKFKINAFDDKLTTWLQKNTKAVKNFGPQIEQLRQKFRSLGDSVTTDQLKEFEAELKAIDSAAAAAGQKGKTFADQFKGAFASITKYVSVSTIIYQAIRAAKQMAQAVYDIDTAMTELKKVTDETATTYDKFLSDAGEKAKQMGVAISDYITSVADFARLGYDFKEAQNLADVANIYNVVGDDVDNIETATQTVISNLTAFGIAASDAITIVDELNSVGNAFAISSGGLGDALTRSASSMAAANNTLEETIGLITAANTVVQDPESVGTAYKIISMRLRAAETELQQAGLDTEGMAESTAKLREEIMALSGVDIMINDDTFKSTYQILDELAAKWGELTDIQQASLTELIAGSRLPDRTAMCA